MKNVLLLLVYLLTVVAKLLGPGGIKGIVAETFYLSSNCSLSAAPDNELRICFRLTDFFSVCFHYLFSPAAL